MTIDDPNQELRKKRAIPSGTSTGVHHFFKKSNFKEKDMVYKPYQYVITIYVYWISTSAKFAVGTRQALMTSLMTVMQPYYPVCSPSPHHDGTNPMETLVTFQVALYCPAFSSATSSPFLSIATVHVPVSTSHPFGSTQNTSHPYVLYQPFFLTIFSQVSSNFLSGTISKAPIESLIQPILNRNVIYMFHHPSAICHLLSSPGPLLPRACSQSLSYLYPAIDKEVTATTHYMPIAHI